MSARPAAPARVAGPARGGMAPVRVGAAGVTRPAGSIGLVRSNHLVFNNRFHHRPFFRNCFGSFNCRDRFLNSGFVFPFSGPFYFDPFWDNYSGPEAQPVVSGGADNSGNVQLAMEVQRLSDQIEDLRQEERRAAAPAQPKVWESAKTPADSTTFVFRDGHRISTENYAIVGDTLWVLNEHIAKKVPLDNLDKSATEQANAANGIELHLP